MPDLASLSDAELVAHARQALSEPGGKAVADRCLAVVFERHERLVRITLAAKMPGGKVEDASQQVWLRFWRKVATSAEEIRAPAGLLVRIARFVIADVAAGRDPHTAELDESVAGEAEPLAALDATDLAERLLAGLPDRSRAVVIGRILEDLPSAQVAAALGTTPGNVDVMLHRALEAMRRAAL